MNTKEIFFAMAIDSRGRYYWHNYNATISASTVSSRRLLIKMENNKGPRGLPWGTLEVTGVSCDPAPSIMTLYIRPPR